MENNVIFNDEIDFPKLETIILKYWDEIDAFQSSLEQSKNKKLFTFYDGPPFATGLPHFGHILAGTIKDIVTRYAHQTGHHVERRFGWDCHGVPIEFEIDKQENITGPEDVMKMGVDVYNNKCRSIVMKYSKEWEESVKRLGRWIDFENDYKTMYPWFMESVWNVFKCVFEKGLVYRGVKVLPFSTACATPLSNFEAKLNFKEVNDPAVVISFPLVSDPEVEMLAWTTTPWTLPSNLALCVHPELDYVKLKHDKTDKLYIIMEARIGYVFKKDKVTVIEKFKGKSLENLEYVPLFEYFMEMKSLHGAFRVLCDGYVTADSGTGVVHQSPYFGEDDYRVCMSYGVIKKDSKVVCPVDATGKFTDEVKDFAGQYVKDADKNITKMLKTQDRLFSQGNEKHNYPFCWRSDTPLLYKAVPSWFIGVETIVDKLLASNADTYWVPDFVKMNRFGNWLKDARDWAVSRNRYWGTPIPLWLSDDMEEVVCVGSVEELYQLSGVKVSDLHKENIDQILIPSRTGRGMLRRIPEVFDCWFESGCMPYAQQHFPFSMTPEKFQSIFPADFIAEGLDQTRGWFYTLTVIGTILFEKSPFKNLIVNGIVLAADGQKMSKRLKNYPDPIHVINKFGADALRLYLINSPVVRAQNLRFQESGVKDILRDVFLPWYNTFKFLINSSLLPLEKKTREGRPLLFRAGEAPKRSNNTMDRWIVSFTQSLVRFIRAEMALYRLDTVIPQLVRYIDQLTNWYVRMNRRRLRGETVDNVEDWQGAVHTLFFVLHQTTLTLAPFVPFLTEHLFQKLRLRLESEHSNDDEVASRSVHFQMIPECADALIDSEVEKSVALMQTVVELGRKIRDQEKLPLKQPLLRCVVVADDAARLQREMAGVLQYVRDELNVREIVFSSDKAAYGVQLRAELNHKVLGARLKGDYKKVLEQSRLMSADALAQFQVSGSTELCGHELGRDDLQVVVVQGSSGGSQEDASQYRSMAESGGALLVLLDVCRTPELVREGLAREVVNRIQRRRKELGLVPDDPVHIYVDCSDQRLAEAVREWREDMDRVVQQPLSLEAPRAAEVCSLVSDEAGTECEIRVDDESSGAGVVLLVRLWFRHDHSRLCKDRHRQCTAAETALCSGSTDDKTMMEKL